MTSDIAVKPDRTTATVASPHAFSMRSIRRFCNLVRFSTEKTSASEGVWLPAAASSLCVRRRMILAEVEAVWGSASSFIEDSSPNQPRRTLEAGPPQPKHSHYQATAVNIRLAGGRLELTLDDIAPVSLSSCCPSCCNMPSSSSIASSSCRSPSSDSTATS